MRSDDEIQYMLEEAITLRDEWKEYFHSGKMTTKENAQALRNYTALRGVVKTLRWVTGKNNNPLE